MSSPNEVGNSPKLILFFMADQIRADHLGFGGGRFDLTPNLDALAAAGTIFDRAFVTNPTCMPSRASIATGRWPSVHGTRTNGVPLDPTAETFMGALRREGWRTSAVGKLHLQTMGWDAEPHQLDEIAATNPWAIDPGLRDARSSWDGHASDLEFISRHRAEIVAMPDNYYGFDSVDLVSGHGDRASGHYWHWARRNGLDIEALAGHTNGLSRSEVWDHVWVSGVPAELSTASYVAEQTKKQVDLAANRTEPTLIFASFPDPHHPFCPPAEYANLVAADDVELPATFYQDPTRVPPHIATMLGQRGVPNDDAMLTFAVTEQQYREAFVHQAGLLRMIDDAVGEILDAVTNAGLLDDTLILFTADHGDLFGEHGLMLKHHVHYEPVTRVPLVVKGPGVMARRGNSLVSLADVAPTVLDAAGVTPFRGIQGRSLLDVTGGGTDEHRDAVLIEEDLPFGTVGIDGPVRIRTLVTYDGRLTVYNGESFAECYDFATDPDETHNLHGDGTALESSLRDRMLTETFSLADEGQRMSHGA